MKLLKNLIENYKDMGYAFILSGCDFSAKNLGQVTPLEDVPVTGLSIVANDSYTGTTAQLSAAYTPATSNQKGVVWSISSGGAYATINSSTGVLTILSGANANNITVVATSIYDSSVVASKSINVTFKETVDELTSILINGADVVNGIGESSQYSVSYTPSNTSYIDVTWSITSGTDYATINSTTGLLEVVGTGSVTIKATSVNKPEVTATKTITVSSVFIQPAIYMSCYDGRGGVLTDIVVSDISNAEMELMAYVINSGSNTAIAGSRTSGTATDRFCIIGNLYGKSYCWNVLCGNQSANDPSTPEASSRTINKYKVTKEGGYLNGELVSFSSTPTIQEVNTAPIAIGDIYNNGTKSWHFSPHASGEAGARYGYLKIWENNVLTHNLQPYKDGIDFGFEDKITGKKYSAASISKANYIESINQ